MIKRNSEDWGIFWGVEPILGENNLRTFNVHYWLPLVEAGWRQQPPVLFFWGGGGLLIGNLKFEVPFLTMWMDGKLRDSKVRFLQDRAAILLTSHRGDILHSLIFWQCILLKIYTGEKGNWWLFDIWLAQQALGLNLWSVKLQNKRSWVQSPLKFWWMVNIFTSLGDVLDRNITCCDTESQVDKSNCFTNLRILQTVPSLARSKKN